MQCGSELITHTWLWVRRCCFRRRLRRWMRRRCNCRPGVWWRPGGRGHPCWWWCDPSGCAVWPGPERFVSVKLGARTISAWKFGTGRCKYCTCAILSGGKFGRELPIFHCRNIYENGLFIVWGWSCNATVFGNYNESLDVSGVSRIPGHLREKRCSGALAYRRCTGWRLRNGYIHSTILKRCRRDIRNLE